MSSRFPHEEPLVVGDHELSARDLIELLEPRLTEHRRELIRRVVSGRTYSICPVLDGIHDLGNVAAVMRTAEALGFQPFHVLETQEKYKKAKTRITQGADKWLDVRRWRTPAPCIDDLRSKGYRIVATHLDASVPIQEVDFSVPTAVVFGNEKDGVSQEILDVSDQNVVLPMNGFSQSFNISVAAAITLWHIRTDRAGRPTGHADLDEKERRILTADYYLRAVRRSERFVEALMNRNESP